MNKECQLGGLGPIILIIRCTHGLDLEFQEEKKQDRNMTAD